MSFWNNLGEEIDNIKQRTENGALGFKSSGDDLVDINFKVSSYRNLSDEEFIRDFAKVYYQDKVNAIKWIFFARDVREGMGERRIFRLALRFFSKYDLSIVHATMRLVHEYGRWDDLISVVGYNPVLDNVICNYLLEVLKGDILTAIREGDNISLLAKWLPSENASSIETKKKARFLMKKFGFSPKAYRKTLSLLRKHIDVVERKMSSNQWNKIDYAKVPSKANLNYKNAFIRHDEKRRTEYLEKLANGEEKINSSTLFPYEILKKYDNHSNEDVALEEMWKALPDYVDGEESTIVVADGSWSMHGYYIEDSSAQPIHIANSLAIYFAERCKGEFENKYISFSETPQLVNLKGSLRDKIMQALFYNEVADTNIEAVFDLILETAIKNKMDQSEIPANVLIISDMEFNEAVDENSHSTLFESIDEKFKKFDYKMPKLSFWNVCGRMNAVPIQENENGVSLVSGFSPSVASMVLSNKLDPKEVLMEKLNSKRYNIVEDNVKWAVFPVMRS